MPTTTKALRAWKNFVLRFRTDFDHELGLSHSGRYNFEPPELHTSRYASLSLLLYALATSLSMDAERLTDSRQSQRAASNPKYKNPTLDLDDALRRSKRLYDQHKLALPPELPFLFLDNPADYPTQFSKILRAIEASEIKNYPHIIGYTYQFWRDSDRKIAQSEIQSADKQIDKAKLVAFTQIYTPDWVVEFIVANSLLPLLEPHLANLSKLQRWLSPQHFPAKPRVPSSISILDPAAGSGNFLLGAFDALFELLTKSGLPPEEAVTSIAKQLHGCDIDTVALCVAAIALVTRCNQFGVKSTPTFHGLTQAIPSKDALLGSLSTNFPDSHPLSKQHSVVITNPPYIGRKLISRDLKGLLKSHWPDSHHDLSAAFFERSLSLLEPGGRVGLITQASMLSLPSHAKLRALILDRYHLKTTVDAGPGVFPLQSGEKVNSAILIVEKPHTSLEASHAIRKSLSTNPKTPASHLSIEVKTASADTGSAGLQPASKIRQDSGVSSIHEIRDAKENVASFFNLKQSDDKENVLLEQLAYLRQGNHRTGENGSATIVQPELFRQFHGHAFNYSIPPVVAQLLTHAPTLESIADIRQGLATTDNDRFVKLIWQVNPEEIGRVWYPYVKGAGGQRYSSPIRHVVNWQDNGADIKAAVAERYPYLKGKTAWVVKNEAFYFKEGLCFSFVNTRGIAVRKLPPNCIFDVGASAIFSDCNDFLLAYLNSSFMVSLANSLNPTINNQVGDLKRFPVLQFDESIKRKLSDLARECCDIKEQIDALIDPSTWFSNRCSTKQTGFSPSRQSSPSSHSFYTTLGPNGDDCSEFKQFETLLLNLQTTLDSKEFEIDEIVLESIANVENWDEKETGDVKRWIESCNTRTATSLPTGLQNIFAHNNRLHSILNLAPVIVSSVDDSLVSNKSHVHSTNQATDKEPRSTAQSTRNGAVSTSSESFRSHIEKYFLGFPPEPLRSFHLKGIVC